MRAAKALAAERLTRHTNSLIIRYGLEDFCEVKFLAVRGLGLVGLV